MIDTDRILDRLIIEIPKIGYVIPVDEARGAMEEFANQKLNDWHTVKELLPPFGIEVEIPGAGDNIFIASVYECVRNIPSGNLTKFLYHDERIEGIEFCYPEKWRFKQ